MKKIASFDGLRFFAAIIIVLLHIGAYFKVPYPFRQGYLAVELFFILSGFLLAKNYEILTRKATTQKNSIQLCKTYFFHRFIRLWPEYFFATIMTFLLYETFTNIKIPLSFLNTFMMGGWGGIPYIVLPFWYVTVVFWCSCLLFNILILGKEKAKTLILPITAILCLFCIFNIKRRLDSTTQLIPFAFLSGGTIRGLLGLIIGIYTYWGCQALKNYKAKWNPNFVRIALFLGEIVSVIGLGYVLIFQKKASTGLFNIYFYIPFLIGLLYFQRATLLNFLSWKIWKPFARISYSLYLAHIIVIDIFKTHYWSWGSTHIISASILVITLSFALALFCYYGQKYLFKFLKKIALKND